jgi:isochorismate hydrolase
MKEAYFQPENIEEISLSWLSEFGSGQSSKKQTFTMDQAALLILDMQDYFLDPGSHAFVPAGQAIIPRLNRVIREFRNAGRPVLATRHLNDTENAGRMATWWSDLITAEHPRSEIHTDLDIGEEEILIKTQYDAFYGSELEHRLSQQEISQLVIGGVMTHLCCETTARSAFVRGWEVFFLIDGTATYEQEFHRASLRNLSHGIAVLTTTDSLTRGQSTK